jgi:hypothetical protein
MKKLSVLFFIIYSIIFVNLQAQEYNKVGWDSIKQQEILIGPVTLQGLNSGEFGRVFWENYSTYFPDSSVIKSISINENEFHFKLIMGTWCGDSKEQVPRFYKILDLLKYNSSDVEVLCLDRKFKEKSIEAKQLNITKIPTIIVLKNNTEIGRIIETPSNTLEKDLFSILKNPTLKN